MFSPSGTQGLCSFPATLSASATSSVAAFVHCQSVGQNNRVEWLLSFSKMTNIHRQCSFFRISFPAGAKMLHSPANQMSACHMHHHCAHHLNARQNQSSAHNARATPAPPTFQPTSNGRKTARSTLPPSMAAIPVCLLLAHAPALPAEYIGEPCMIPVSCVTTAKLSPPGSSMSATNRGLVRGLVSPFSKYNTGVSCVSGAELCLLIPLCGID